MNVLKAIFKKLAFWFLKRSRTEQMLVGILLASCWYSVWDNWIHAWYLRTSEAQWQEQVAYQADILQLESQIARFNLDEAKNNFENLKKTLAQAELEYTHLNEKATAAQANTTSPREVIKLIKDILKKIDGIRLVSIEGLPALVNHVQADNAAPQPAGTPDLAVGADGAHMGWGALSPGNSVPEAGLALYKPGLKLVLEGSYFQTMFLLKGLEGSHWRIYWDSLLLDVDTYPKCVVTLTIRTLSAERDWNGEP